MNILIIDGQGGIILQIILIPIVVMILEKTKLIGKKL